MKTYRKTIKFNKQDLASYFDIERHNLRDINNLEDLIQLIEDKNSINNKCNHIWVNTYIRITTGGKRCLKSIGKFCTSCQKVKILTEK